MISHPFGSVLALFVGGGGDSGSPEGQNYLLVIQPEKPRPERLGDMPSVTQLVISGVGIQTQILGPYNSSLSHNATLPLGNGVYFGRGWQGEYNWVWTLPYFRVPYEISVLDK